MFNNLTNRSSGFANSLRRGMVASAAVAMTLGSALTLAAPAGAATSLAAPGNATIVGAGSATTYDMMVKLGTLFNAAPSCDLYQPSTASSAVTPQNFTCVTDANPSQTSPAIYPASVARTPVNPFGDVALQEPPVGSSVGIKILSNQGAKGVAGVTSGGQAISVANNVSFARSSRATKTTDYQGLNFVAYAKDGLSWSHYALTGTGKGKATNSSSVTNLTKAQLQAIFNTGTAKNWNSVGGTVAAPIVVFSAQVGSGTWDSWGGYVVSSAGYKTSDPTNPVNCYDTTDASTCQGPAVIFENETASIKVSSLPTNLQSPNAAVLSHFHINSATVTGTGTKKSTISVPVVCSQWIWGCDKGVVTGSGTAYSQTFTLVTPTDDTVRGDSIFFYSTGKWNYQCSLQASTSKISTCGGNQPDTGYSYVLGNIEGNAPTAPNVLQGIFGATRLLYNVYANGSNANLGAASAATMNFVGENGFLCRPGTVTDIDPNTGASYRSEINAAILSEGFYPISAGASSGVVNTTPVDMGTLTHPAATTTSGSKYADYTNGRSTTSGFCILTTTDVNSVA